MKQNLKKITSLFLAIALVFTIVPFNINYAYADSDYVDNFTIAISKDGGVIVTYNNVTKELIISGSGKIDYDLWCEMARQFDERNYGNEEYKVILL